MTPQADPKPGSRSDPLVGQEVGSGIRVLRPLANGELFTVYEADGGKRGKLALKLPHHAYGSAAAELTRFEREAKLDHPLIPKLLDEIDVLDRRALVYPLIVGESAAALAARRPGRIPPAEALRVAVRVLDPLVSLHAGGAAHGTIVLSHVLLDDNGGVHLIGLGEARVKESLGIALDRRFFPPEQFGNARPSVIGDLWGVAAVLYALLTGRNAFGAELGQIPRQPTPVPLAKVAKHAPPELAALVDRALDVDPGKRFAHAAALRAAMQHVSQQRDVFYCHALGSALAPASSSQPLLDAARALRAATTAPPMMGASTDPPPTATPRSPMQAVIPVPPVRDSMSPVSSTRSVTRERSETPTGLGPPYEPSLESSPPGRSKEQRSPRPFVAPPIQAMMHAETKPAIPSADGQPLARRRREAEMAAGLITEGDAETTALGALVSALSRALEARDEASSTELARTAEKSLERAPRGLTFGVQEQSLVSGTRPVWQAPGTLETPVRALYRAGVASFVFLPGVTRNELDTLVEALSRLSLSEEAPDTLALLGDADFEHILFHIPDLLPLDGDTALERDKKRLLSLLAFDSSFQLEEAWAAARLSGVTRGGRLASRISALARTAEQSGAPPFADDHDYDPVRLARVAACSFDGPAFEPALAAFGPRLRAQLAQLALERPDSVLEAVLHVVHSTRAPKHALTDRQREVVAALVSPELVGQILKRLGTAADAALDELRELFPLLGSEHAAGIAAALPEIGNLALRAEAEHFLEYDASGHEQALGEQARNAEPKTALELVRLLGRAETLAAKAGLDIAARSPHAVVRIEALGLRDGPSGEALRLELRARLEEASSVDRIRMLRELGDFEIKVAAPFIALRLRSEHVDDLPHEERRQLFAALCKLAPARAATIATEILERGRVISGEAHEETRALAAEALGRVGNSQEALEVLADQSTRRWKGSELVREAAQRALEMVVRRLEGDRPSQPARGSRPPPKGGAR